LTARSLDSAISESPGRWLLSSCISRPSPTIAISSASRPDSAWSVSSLSAGHLAGSSLLFCSGALTWPGPALKGNTDFTARACEPAEEGTLCVRTYVPPPPPRTVSPTLLTRLIRRRSPLQLVLCCNLAALNFPIVIIVRCALDPMPSLR